jgi:hypothetical protein
MRAARRIGTWAVATSLAVGVVAPAAPAIAHVRVWPTHLTMSVTDARVVDGEEVRFRGRLSSPRRACARREVVKIVRNRTVVARAVTDRDGRYAVTEALHRGGMYRAVSRGSTLRDAPDHFHACAGVVTDRLRIRVV